MDMNILKYMAFVRTVEYGSFTKAAEILNYSQSGISRMINDLEKEWKVVLLERSRAGVCNINRQDLPNNRFRVVCAKPACKFFCDFSGSFYFAGRV